MFLSVKSKIVIARILNRGLRLGRKLGGRNMRTVCRRRGVRWDLDLDEGIDLYIYLLGSYEADVRRHYRKLLGPGAVVFDVGANMGAHTLHFARLVGDGGRVYAFEPTDYAFAKLQRNLALNPALARRVRPQQRLLVGEEKAELPATVCSSWPIDHWTSRPTADDLDAWHSGLGKPLAGATAITADAFFEAEGLARLDLVKIDVDGNESAVLHGLRRTLTTYRPPIVIELAPFAHERNASDTFDESVLFLAGLGYRFFDATTLRPIPRTGVGLRAAIPEGSSINAVLRPSS